MADGRRGCGRAPWRGMSRDGALASLRWRRGAGGGQTGRVARRGVAEGRLCPAGEGGRRGGGVRTPSPPVRSSAQGHDAPPTAGTTEVGGGVGGGAHIPRAPPRPRAVPSRPTNPLRRRPAGEAGLQREHRPPCLPPPPPPPAPPSPTRLQRVAGAAAAPGCLRRARARRRHRATSEARPGPQRLGGGGSSSRIPPPEEKAAASAVPRGRRRGRDEVWVGAASASPSGAGWSCGRAGGRRAGAPGSL